MMKRTNPFAHAVAIAMMAASPIFGERSDFSFRRVASGWVDTKAIKRRVARQIKISNQKPHQGDKERARHVGRVQFPEFVKVERTAMECGRWVP